MLYDKESKSWKTRTIGGMRSDKKMTIIEFAILIFLGFDNFPIIDGGGK